MTAYWWDQLAAEIEAPDDGHVRHSAAWYAAMRDAHAARFPDADERSKANMRQLADDAARREARVLGSDASVAVGRFRPDGPLGYRAHTAPDAPLRATRAEAVADESAWLDGSQGVLDFGEATG